MQTQEKVRKVRSDKGLGRSPYKVKGSTKVDPETKPGVATPKLNKHEMAILNIVHENAQVLTAMADGSLPFVLGMLAAKSFDLINDRGNLRKRMIRRMLQHLQNLNLIKVDYSDKSMSHGCVQLV